MQSIIKTDLKIIKCLVNRNMDANNFDIMYVAHYFIASEKEKEKLVAENRQLGGKVEQLTSEIQDLEDMILRDPTVQLIG